MKIILFLIVVIVISSCSLAISSSGVLPLGDDTYTVSTDNITTAEAKKAAFEDAITFCKKTNKSIKVIETSDTVGSTYTLNFKCQ